MSPRREGRYCTVPIATFFVGLAILVGCFVSCGVRTPDKPKGEKTVQPRSIEQVLKEHTDRWMSINGVVGTGIGKCKGKPCIKVFVVEGDEQLRKRIPTQVEGFPVIVEVTGEIRALDADDSTGAE